MGLATLVLLGFTALPRAEGPPPASPSAIIFERVRQNPDDLSLVESAQKAIELQIERTPDDAMAHYVRGWIQRQVGKPAAALKSLDRALALDPQMAVAHVDAGLALLALGKKDDALARFEKATTLDPRQVEGFLQAGDLLLGTRKPKEALARYSAALAEAPRSCRVLERVRTAQNVLGLVVLAQKTRAELVAAWKESDDKDCRAREVWTFDQYEVDGHRVTVLERLEPGGREYDLYVFEVRTPDGRLAFRIRFVHDDVLTERGASFMVRIAKGEDDSAIGLYFAEAPEYPILKTLLESVIRERLPAQSVE